jgi:F-type H+-transporting ATPase subunit gamma
MDVDSLKVFFHQRPVSNVLLVVITSDRGLCGGFNANVIKLTNSLINGEYAGKKVTILPVGRKAFEFYGKTDLNLIPDFKDTYHHLNAETGFAIGEYVLNQFKAGKFDKVEVVYNQFKNAATQILVNEPFLPIVSKPVVGSTSKNDFIYEPGKAEILEALIPRILKTQIFKSLLDSFASEHGARMIAMDKATDNAGELIKALKLEYNRARQSAITTEISEIVGGAAALSGS